MFGRFPEPTHMPCPDCGASVARPETSAHVCERERWLDFQMFRKREEVGRLPGELGAYLDSAEGQFELWYAERERLREERRKRGSSSF